MIRPVTVGLFVLVAFVKDNNRVALLFTTSRMGALKLNTQGVLRSLEVDEGGCERENMPSGPRREVSSPLRGDPRLLLAGCAQIDFLVACMEPEPP